MLRIGNILLILLFFSPLSGMTQDAVEANISEKLKRVFGGVEITSIRESSLPGMYEVMLGAEILYASADGQYVLQGDLIDINNLKNLSEERRSSARTELLANVPADEIIEFSPENADHYLYVFTDITCGYCQKLHNDIAELNNNGIGIRYLAFPRRGLNSADYVDMQSVWCANDQHKALTDAKFRQDVEPANCNNPVAKHFNLGQDMGVTGTPAVFTENGKQIGGYAQPDRILQLLKGN